MGPQRDTDAGDDPAGTGDSIESLLRSTDRDTEEIVEALRESGPRRHVSETNVDEVLTELSEPQGDADDQFALSGGPTRTVSTSGIDEVFETLEAQAPSLPAEPQVTASNGSAGGESGATESGGASTAMAANSSGGMAASADRSGSAAVAFDSADDSEPDDEESEPFGSLVGGEPTRRISDESVDDILDTLADDTAESAAEPPGREDGEAIDDLRPNDPEGELVDLLADDEPNAEPTAEDPGTESNASPSAESGSDGRAEVASPTDTPRIEDAAAKLARTGAAAESESTADPSAAPSADDGFEWADPGANERSSSPTDESAPVESGSEGTSRPLVTRTELERIAGLVSESESVEGSVSESRVGSRSERSQDGNRAPAPKGASGDEPGPTRNDAATDGPTGPAPTASASRMGSPQEAVSVDGVIAPTDALGVSARDTASGIDDRNAASGGNRTTSGAAVGDGSTDPSEREAGPGEPSVVHGIRAALRRLVGRLRR